MQVKRPSTTVITIALVTLTWASVTTGAVYSVFKSFPAPEGTQPNGLAWDGRYLWMSSYMRNGGIYKLDPEDGSVLGTFTPPVAPSDGYGGLTFDGTYLWHTTFYSHLMDKLTLPDLVVVSRIPCPKSSPSDMAWDGSSLWTCDGGHSPRLYKVDPGTGEVLLQFDVPGTGQSQTAGLAYGGDGREPGCLWLSWRSEIFKLDPSDGHVIASMPAPCLRAESLAWDGSYLWVASFNGMIYQMEIAQPTGRVIYVDDDAGDTNDGLSWDSAYNNLQDAIEEAQYGNEIRVAQGIYKPDRELMRGRSITVVASGDRTATFQLKNGVAIKGGYAGTGSLNPDARNIDLYKTILSGDLNGDDGPNFTNIFENSYHVVTGSGTNETAVLDGFTITGGNANGPFPHDHGGGMFNSSGSPTVINCNFSTNSALQHGGGMDNSDSHPKLTNCIFVGNAVELKYGGGIHNYNSTPTLINCIFTGNIGESQGGGMFNDNHSNAILINCTFNANTAADSGGIGNDLESNPTLTNCIIWGNLAVGEVDESVQIQGGTPVINYCCINGWSGMLGSTGNHGLDPLFADADGLDNIPGTEDDNLRLLPDSPCIDKGDNSAIPQSIITDLDGNPRIVNGTVDMGAYESDVVTTANIRYVDAVNGNDNNDGLTPQAAYATIQKGIDAASSGEIVLVYPGLYQKEINFLGKKLTVQGIAISPDGVPVLHNPGDYAVSFNHGEGPDSILKNLIIRDSFMGVFIANSSPTLSNLTIVGNKYGIEANAGSEPDISNIILWNNTDGDLFGCRARYSCVERGDEGNISDDPLFVDPENGDYHIRSEQGRYWPEHDIWVLDNVTSPCVDGGDPDADILNEPIPHGGRINIGAYGGTTEASLSPSEQPNPLSGKASNPYPADGAVDVKGPLTFTWTAGLNAVSHYIYFGSDKDDVSNADTSNTTGIYRGYQFTTSYTPPEGIRLSSTPYYWRIDEADSKGNTTTGDVWTFTTIPPPPPKGRACFTSETNVWVDGALIQISKVAQGQRICSINYSGKIQEVQKHNGKFMCYDILLESGNCLSVAENHYFMTESGRWISLQNLKKGTRLKTAKGTVGIINITKRAAPYTRKVFNLKIEGSDQYMVGKDAIVVRDY